jgi:hypothetical protein
VKRFIIFIIVLSCGSYLRGHKRFTQIDYEIMAGLGSAARHYLDYEFIGDDKALVIFYDVNNDDIEDTRTFHDVNYVIRSLTPDGKQFLRFEFLPNWFMQEQDSDFDHIYDVRYMRQKDGRILQYDYKDGLPEGDRIGC